MNCELHTAKSLARTNLHLLTLLRDNLTKPESDFNKKLTAWIGGVEPLDRDGHIALVLDHGEIVGWARTEVWSDGNGAIYDTLEAFVAPEYRLRGVAAYASSAIYSGVLHDCGLGVAVFSPVMMLVAKRAGFFPTLFTPIDGRWVRV